MVKHSVKQSEKHSEERSETRSDAQRGPLGGLGIETRIDGTTTLVLRGEARREVLGALDAAAVACAPEGDLVLDLSGLEFMDSAALGALLRLDARLRSRGGRLVLSRPRSVVRRLIGVFGVGGVLRVAEADGGAPAPRGLGRGGSVRPDVASA